MFTKIQRSQISEFLEPEIQNSPTFYSVKNPTEQDCVWGAWSDWGDCSKCGGQRYRQRAVVKMPNDALAICTFLGFRKGVVFRSIKPFFLLAEEKKNDIEVLKNTFV